MAVHRGFDIGNHFCEWCYCYDNCDFPYFTASLEEYPSRDQQVSVMLLMLFILTPCTVDKVGYISHFLAQLGWVHGDFLYLFQCLILVHLLEMCCWSSERGILTELSLCCGIVHHCNSAQWYEQFLQVGRLDQASILFALVPYLPSTSEVTTCGGIEICILLLLFQYSLCYRY